MSDLKIRVSLGSFNVEIEGPSEDVTKQFEEIKKNGLGQMVDQLLPIFSNQGIQKPPSDNKLIQAVIEENPTAEQPDNSIELMSLHDLSSKELPKSEREWVLMYAYYIDRSGKLLFTRDDIIKKYEESNRKKSVRMKNLSNSIRGAEKETWISRPTDSEMKITEPGKTQAKQILTRSEGTIKVPKQHKKIVAE